MCAFLKLPVAIRHQLQTTETFCTDKIKLSLAHEQLSCVRTFDTFHGPIMFVDSGIVQVHKSAGLQGCLEVVELFRVWSTKLNYYLKIL